MIHVGPGRDLARRVEENVRREELVARVNPERGY
jgi:hypothetical protein